MKLLGVAVFYDLEGNPRCAIDVTSVTTDDNRVLQPVLHITGPVRRSFPSGLVAPIEPPPPERPMLRLQHPPARPVAVIERWIEIPEN